MPAGVKAMKAGSQPNPKEESMGRPLMPLRRSPHAGPQHGGSSTRDHDQQAAFVCVWWAAYSLAGGMAHVDQVVHASHLLLLLLLSGPWAGIVARDGDVGWPDVVVVDERALQGRQDQDEGEAFPSP